MLSNDINLSSEENYFVGAGYVIVGTMEQLSKISKAVNKILEKRWENEFAILARNKLKALFKEEHPFFIKYRNISVKISALNEYLEKTPKETQEQVKIDLLTELKNERKLFAKQILANLSKEEYDALANCEKIRSIPFEDLFHCN